MKATRIISFVLLGFITLLGFGIRFYKLTESPGGLYIDETSIGFNAYSIVTTGRDEHGVKFPLFFEAFGEYKLPVYIYLVALFQLLLGPTDLTIRLPSLICGTLIIPTFYFLLKELVFAEKNTRIREFVPLVGAFMLSISPWHFFFSRPGFEGGVGLFFVTAALWLFFRSLRLKAWWLLILAYMSFTLALYTYNSARVVVPMSMGVLFILYIRRFKFLTWIMVLSIFCFLTLPFWKFSLSDAGNVRARQMTFLYEPLETSLPKFARNYYNLLSPHLWYIYGSPIIQNDTKHRMPLIYPFDAVFILTGILLVVIRRRRELLFMFFFLFLGLVPSAVTRDSPHSLRAILSLPPFLFLGAYGLGWMLSLSKSRAVNIGLAGSYVLVILVSFISFLNIFHGPYVRDAAGDWQVNYRRIGEDVLKIAPRYDRIYFADGFNLMPLWWYLHIKPKALLETVDRRDVGKYQFGTKNPEAIPLTSSVLYIGSEKPPNGDLITHVYMPKGDKITSLWSLRADAKSLPEP